MLLRRIKYIRFEIVNILEPGNLFQPKCFHQGYIHIEITKMIKIIYYFS